MPCSNRWAIRSKHIGMAGNSSTIRNLDDVVCLIVDQKMPEMTGLALLRELNHTGRAIPSLLITGLPDAQVTGEARELGAIDVLVKPIDWEKLLKLVAYAVQ